ncbi:MAG: DUF21 domain-containing protein, partial [Actinomycetales bacterium]|nr:DUF21 domain-containing protein [Actinomycetales bacterium]
MVPKNIALASPDKASLILGPFMLGVVFLLKPLVVALNFIANMCLKLMKIEPKDEVASTYSHDEVAGLVEESRREGLLDDDEYELVSGALDFQGGTVAQVLLPRDSLVTIEAEATPIDIELACAQTGYSRFPVRDAVGDFSGYLHIKDVLETDLDRRSLPIADKWLRPLSTVATETGLYEALRVMQARGSHMARVADGNGGVVGVV